MGHQRLWLTESQCSIIPKIFEYLTFPVHSYPLNGQASFKEGLKNNSSEYLCYYFYGRILYSERLSFKSKDRGFPSGAVVKNLAANAGTWVQALAWEDPTCHGATKPMCHKY